MSSLIVSNDLNILMLELVVDKLFVPRKTKFDEAILKKTIVRFRMLDDDWIKLSPQRLDFLPYIGSNHETEYFHGGKSIVFSLPEQSLIKKKENINIEINIHKEIAKYFETNSCELVGNATIQIDPLFNHIIRELKERREYAGYYTSYHKRQPVSRAIKGNYKIFDENNNETDANIDLYIRLSYFGKSIITETERFEDLKKVFYVQEETNQTNPYQFRELPITDALENCADTFPIVPKINQNNLVCECDKENIESTGPLQRGQSDKVTEKKFQKKAGREKNEDDGEKKTKSFPKTQKKIIREKKGEDQEKSEGIMDSFQDDWKNGKRSKEKGEKGFSDEVREIKRKIRKTDASRETGNVRKFNDSTRTDAFKKIDRVIDGKIDKDEARVKRPRGVCTIGLPEKVIRKCEVEPECLLTVIPRDLCFPFYYGGINCCRNNICERYC